MPSYLVFCWGTFWTNRGDMCLFFFFAYFFAVPGLLCISIYFHGAFLLVFRLISFWRSWGYAMRIRPCRSWYIYGVGRSRA